MTRGRAPSPGSRTRPVPSVESGRAPLDVVAACPRGGRGDAGAGRPGTGRVTASADPSGSTEATQETAPTSAQWGDRPVATSRSQAGPAPRPRANDDPLRVTIDALTPSYVPRRGQVRVTGSVTNTTRDRYVAVNMHAFVSADPIRTSRQLAREVERDPAEPVGDRITRTGSFDTVEAIDPGESVQYSIKLKAALLEATEPGAYWFGVHAMGDAGAGRDGIADGRARTFLPLAAGTGRLRNAAVDTALVVPIRHDVRHEPDGRVAEVARWSRTLSPGGPLRTLVDFGASAGDLPVTWLLDPAVPTVVQRLVDGNPPRSLGDTEEPPSGEESATPDPSAEPDDQESSEPTDEPSPETNAATEPGSTWLARLREAMKEDEVLALPYGDLDLAAAATRNPGMYARARSRSVRALTQLGLDGQPAAASLDGSFDPAALPMLPRRTTVLVGDEMYGGAAPSRARISGRTLTATSSSTRAGGPGPDSPLAGVALRQRILSEAAVRLLAPGDRALVVVLPHRWNPVSTTGFFAGLDVDWLNLTTVDTLALGRAPRIDRSRLTYPDEQVDLALDEANFDSATSLIDSGNTLERVLLRNDEVSEEVRDQALTALSYSARQHPNASRAELDRANRWIGAQLGSITVDAPPAVTLSSTSGGFSATIENDLEHPVRVRVEAVADSSLTIEGSEAIDVPAGGRASVPLEAATDRLGVHNVELIVTDEDGTPLGSTDTLPIRPTNVSSVIWVILGIGVVLLFGAIFVRLIRRVLRARSSA